MTGSAQPRFTDLTPADGLPTPARRLIDRHGVPIDPDEVHKYIRVKGSTLKNLEPHFWGDGMAIALAAGEGERGYYITKDLRRISITVRKVHKKAKDRVRNTEFSNDAWRSSLRKNGMTPWHEIPENCARQRFLMFLCQERPELLIAVGYRHDQIDRCATGGFLGNIVDDHGKPVKRNGRVVRFEVHHRIPLQFGGSNDISNLCLVDKRVHGACLHKGDDTQMNTAAPGQVCKIALTVPSDDVFVMGVGFNVRVLADEDDSGKGRAT